MNLGHCISQLLQENETVIIPAFGAFISAYKPAEIIEESKQILPPSKEISFTHKIRNNDGLLVSYVAESEGISHFEAMQKIEKEREKILYQLDKGEKIILENTGTLYYDQSNIIQFESFDKENLLLDAFGLEATAFKEISRSNTAVEIETESSELEEEKEDKIQKDNELESVEEFNEWKKKVFEKENKKRSWLWLLFIVIPLIAAGIYILLNQKNSTPDTIEVQKEKASPQNQMADDDGIAETDSLQNDSLSISGQVKTNEQKNSVFETDISGNSSETKYYLVSGSFKEEKNAEKYLQELKEKGYEPFHLGKKGNFFLIGINIYNSEREALKEQRLFLKNNPRTGAWVYIE